MFSLVMFQAKHTNLTGVRPAFCGYIPASESRGNARQSGRESFEQITATNSDTVRAFPDLW